MADLASRITAPPTQSGEAATMEASDLENTQEEGAGGPGLFDSSANVQITLSDLQSDQSTPFYSASKFEDLGL